MLVAAGRLLERVGGANEAGRLGFANEADAAENAADMERPTPSMKLE
jgi:hypothetical protein